MGMKCLGMTHTGGLLRQSGTNWSLNEEELPEVSRRPLDLFSLVALKKSPTQNLGKAWHIATLFQLQLPCKFLQLLNRTLALIFRGALNAKSTQ